MTVKENIIKGGDKLSYYRFDALPSIRTLIHKQLLSNSSKEWIKNENIEPSFIYGIRSYKKGATLRKPHVDSWKHIIYLYYYCDKDKMWMSKK